MSDLSCNDSTESPSSSIYGGPTSPTLVNMPLEEFPPSQPGAFPSHPRIPRLLTPAPHAPVPAGPSTEDPLPPLSSICLLKSSPHRSQAPSPHIPDYLDSFLLLPMLQYPQDPLPRTHFPHSRQYAS